MYVLVCPRVAFLTSVIILKTGDDSFIVINKQVRNDTRQLNYKVKN
jgi:hypothetical protein